jgi:hypothetical protein
MLQAADATRMMLKFCVLSTFLIAVGGSSEASGAATSGSLSGIVLLRAEGLGVHKTTKLI